MSVGASAGPDPLDDAVRRTLVWLWDAPLLDEPAIEARSRALLLDTLGCAISGLADANVRAFADAMAESDPGPLTFPGLPKPLGLAGFLHTFSLAACCFEAPEGLALAQGRPGLHVVPAVLGAAMLRGSRLRDVLAAIVAGYEVGGRIGSIYRIRPGMHVDGTWGTFGAAAGLAHLMRLSVDEAVGAIEHAACHLPASLYYPIRQGSTARNLYVGHGATLAHAAVVAARSGAGGPPGSLRENMRLVLGQERDGFGPQGEPGRWLILDGYLKKYPIVKHAHYGVAAAERWVTDHRERTADAITGVTLRVYRNAITYCGVRAPETPIQAQFSMTYALAHMLATGTFTVDAYQAQALQDPHVRRLEALIAVQADEALTQADRRGATLTVHCGSEQSTYALDKVPGDPELPLTRGELEGKFLSSVAPVLGTRSSRALIDRILRGPAQSELEWAHPSNCDLTVPERDIPTSIGSA